MILDTVESIKLDAPFAEKKVDINHGEFVKILSDAMRQPDKFNPGKFQTIIKVETKNGPRYVNLSQTSINILISTFNTNDAAKWVGQLAKVLLKPSIIGGKKVIVLYLTGPEWELDEYGSPVKENDGSQPEQPDNSEIRNDEVIEKEDVPFN